jgi:hypothetical protein
MAMAMLQQYAIWEPYEFTALPAYKGDFDGDGDVDGSDLADFAEGTATISLKEFATDFGRI